MKYVGDVLDQRSQQFGLNPVRRELALFPRCRRNLGLFGLFFLLLFLIGCACVKGDKHIVLRNALLPYLLERLYHSGAYFTTELYFFSGIYLLNYLESRAEQKAAQVAKRADAQAPPVAQGWHIFPEIGNGHANKRAQYRSRSPC